MSDSTELRTFSRLAEVCGPAPALRLCAFHGGATLYVPQRVDDDHLLVQLLGAEAAGRLVAAFGGRDIWVPGLELKTLRRAGHLRRLMKKHGQTLTGCADALGITERHARRTAAKLLQLEGYPVALFSPGDNA